jgi:hypothetical protein
LQVYVRSGTATVGAALSDRKVVNLRLTSQNNVNLREYARSAGAFDDVPYAVTCTIAAGHVIGSRLGPSAFRTGAWPAGTTIKLVLEEGARICGRGGAGGRGGMAGPGAFNEAGFAGGAGLQMEHDLVIANGGKIQGGGGGGGGGTFVSVPGCGGGGGAGYVASVGGLGGTSPTTGQQLVAGNGGAGSIDLGGLGGVLGGHNSGGNGGGPGQPGAPGGSLGTALTAAAGGAAGPAVRQKTGTTLTWLRTGTVDGATVLY